MYTRQRVCALGRAPPRGVPWDMRMAGSRGWAREDTWGELSQHGNCFRMSTLSVHSGSYVSNRKSASGRATVTQESVFLTVPVHPVS